MGCSSVAFQGWEKAAVTRSWPLGRRQAAVDCHSSFFSGCSAAESGEEESLEEEPLDECEEEDEQEDCDTTLLSHVVVQGQAALGDLDLPRPTTTSAAVSSSSLSARAAPPPAGEGEQDKARACIYAQLRGELPMHISAEKIKELVKALTQEQIEEVLDNKAIWAPVSGCMIPLAKAKAKAKARA